MASDQKILYFLSHPIQYFSPLLRQLAGRADLEVYYFSDASITGKMDKGFGQAVQWDQPLLEGYPSQFLPNYSRRVSMNNQFLDVFNPGVAGVIARKKPAVVIVNGWTYSSTLMAIFFGRLFGAQVWLRAENPLNQELGKKGYLLFLKKLFLKNILFRFFVSRCLYIGQESRLFFEYYGVPPARLVYTPYAVDNHFFSGEAERLKGDRPGLLRKLGLPADKKVILFSGKYIPKKRPLDLIRAFEGLTPGLYQLVMVGEGALRGEMERYIADKGLQGVTLTGFINQSMIPSYYAAADVFVMCSGAGETWGLSVNEAMNFQKPVLVSKTCGCSVDLVKEGENGFVFEQGDIAALTGYLKRVLEDDAFRLSAGKRSGEIIKDFSIDRIVDNIITALPQNSRI